MNHTSFLETSDEPLVNYLRVHRREANLAQYELGNLLGYDNEVAVSRHERFDVIPPFLIALGYEAIFRIQASEIFPGLMQTVELSVEKRLEDFEAHLRGVQARGARAEVIARKLEWIHKRRQLAHK